MRDAILTANPPLQQLLDELPKPWTLYSLEPTGYRAEFGINAFQGEDVWTTIAGLLLMIEAPPGATAILKGHR